MNLDTGRGCLAVILVFFAALYGFTYLWGCASQKGCPNLIESCGGINDRC